MIHVLIRGRNCEVYIEKCLSSIAIQTMPHKIYVCLDCPEDNSYRVLKDALADLEIKDAHIKKNPRRFGLGRNMYEGIEWINRTGAPHSDDIVTIIDADDYIDPRAFNIVEKEYLKYPKTLVTHGSYIKKTKKRKTRISKPYPNRVEFRKHPWRGSHLKTFKWRLWKHVPKDYFKHNGAWAEAASDLALMFCLMELAGRDRIRHIKDPIYTWRDNYCGSTRSNLQKKWDKILRAKKPLKRLEDKNLETWVEKL